MKLSLLNYLIILYHVRYYYNNIIKLVITLGLVDELPNQNNFRFYRFIYLFTITSIKCML